MGKLAGGLPVARQLALVAGELVGRDRWTAKKAKSKKVYRWTAAVGGSGGEGQERQLLERVQEASHVVRRLVIRYAVDAHQFGR